MLTPNRVLRGKVTLDLMRVPPDGAKMTEGRKNGRVGRGGGGKG